MSDEQNISVKEIISLVSQDLLQSRAERLKRGDPAIFEVGNSRLSYRSW